MRQRLGIAASLLRDPRLLLLDEPATGLDPAGMRDMRRLIRRLADGGMTVLLSSHLLGEVEELCNRVAIVRRGAMVYEGAIAELRRSAGARYRLTTSDDARARELCRTAAGISDVGEAHGRITFAAAGEDAVGELSRRLVESGALIHELAPQTVTLEDLFFSLTEGDGSAPVASPVAEPVA
jgi:ABC-2 type transport system ATP-binding protein